MFPKVSLGSSINQSKDQQETNKIDSIMKRQQAGSINQELQSAQKSQAKNVNVNISRETDQSMHIDSTLISSQAQQDENDEENLQQITEPNNPVMSKKSSALHIDTSLFSPKNQLILPQLSQTSQAKPKISSVASFLQDPDEQVLINQSKKIKQNQILLKNNLSYLQNNKSYQSILYRQKVLFESQSNPLNNKQIQKTKTFVNSIKKQFFSKESYKKLDETLVIKLSEYITLFDNQPKQQQLEMKYDEINKYLDGLISLSRKLQIQEITLQLIIAKGKFNYNIGNIYQSLKEFHLAKVLARISKLFPIKMKCYKFIGKNYLENKNLSKAKNAFLKQLVLAWYTNNRYYEIEAYDQLGLIYYYEGNLRYAAVLHQRLSIGKYESNESLIKTYKVGQYEKELMMTEDARTAKLLKNKMYINIKSKIQDNDDIMDSSDDENDDFLREMISNILIQQSKDSINVFDQEKLHFQFYQMKKKRAEQSKQLFIPEENAKQLKLKSLVKLSHLSYNRQVNNYKQITNQDLIQFKNPDNTMFVFIVPPKVLYKLMVTLDKIKKLLVLVINFQYLEKQRQDSENQNQKKSKCHRAALHII